jgi:hypothetical protein
MSRLFRAARMALNMRGVRCDSGWRWVEYISF